MFAAVHLAQCEALIPCHTSHEKARAGVMPAGGAAIAAVAQLVGSRQGKVPVSFPLFGALTLCVYVLSCACQGTKTH